MVTNSVGNIRHNHRLRMAIDLSVRAYEETIGVVEDGTDCCEGVRYDGYVTMQRTKDLISIAFRGTESSVDWMMNLMRYPSCCEFLPGTSVHTGVLWQYLELRTRIRSFVTSAVQTGSVQILVTGHSLGGALSLLCSADLAKTFPLVHVSCYPLNSPRLGNHRFVTQIQRLTNLSVMRINTQHDIVPCIPYFGYVHTPDSIILELSSWKHGIYFYHVRKRHSVQTIKTLFESL
jgi:predicted lipase